MIQKLPKRLLWPDILRTIAIFFVIVVHVSYTPQGIIHTPINIAWIISFSMVKVCVPIFVMVSGAMLLAKKETYGEFFKKRFAKILVPWIFWTFFYLIWNYFFHNREAITLGGWVDLFQLTFLTQYWFIPMIAMLYLLTPILRKLIIKFNQQDIIYMFLLWFILVSFIPFMRPTLAFPRPSEAGLLALAFYYSGYFILGYFLSIIRVSKIRTLTLLEMTVFGIFLTLLNVLYRANTKTLHDTASAYDYFSPTILITSIGFFLLLRKATFSIENTLNKRVKTFVNTISMASLSIYIIHTAVIEAITPIYLNIVNFQQLNPIIVYVYAFLILIVSLLIKILLKKLPLLKYVV